MSNLIKTLFLPTLLYAGLICINDHTLSQINCLWYRVLKTSVGVTLNVKSEICEINLGLPPLTIK